MIVGIGIDIIEVDRVADKIVKDNGFREKVFSANEIIFCEAKGLNKAQHYAGRFAAKEAFLKATGQGLLLSHELNEIEIITNADGKPDIHFHDKLATILPKEWEVMVSLSHIQSAACAVVIIESNSNA